MAFEYAVCPHCGCRCEDDEYCAACGKLFRDDVVARDESLLEILGSNLQSLLKKSGKYSSREGWYTHSLKNYPYSLDQDSDLDFDPSWSCLSSNIYNDDR